MNTPRGKRALPFLAMACLTLSICVVTEQSLAADFYKWVDKQGVTHFSEKPVPGADAKKIGTATKYSESQANAEAAAAETVATAAAANADKPADNPQNIENCKIAQDRLKSLRSGQRIRMVGVDGKFTYLDENQLKEEMEKTQTVIKATCR